MAVLTGLVAIVFAAAVGEGVQPGSQGCSEPGAQGWPCLATSEGAKGTLSNRAQKNPFRDLFVSTPQTKQPAPELPPKPVAGDAPQKRIVCGNVVIQADPNVDPRIAIPLPENAEQFRIRTITTPLCK